jgi:hypothetical protein
MRGRRLRFTASAAVVAALVPAAIAIAGQTPGPVKAPRALAKLTGSTAADPAGVLRGGPIRGMILTGFNESPKGTASDFSRLHMIGVNTVIINVYVHQYAPTSSNVQTAAPDVSDGTLVKLANAAHKAGLAVELEPVVVVDTGRTGGASFFWRGEIAPRSPASWWRYYNALIGHYTAVANSMHAEIFSLGSELASMEKYTANWVYLARWVNARYHGLTTYMSTGAYIFGIPWLNYLDIISMSAYYSLSNKIAPPVSELAYVWQHGLFPMIKSRLYDKFHRRVLINELGYASVVQTAYKPSISYQAGTPASEEEQANAYNAFLGSAASQSSWLAGVGWWHWDTVKALPITDRGYSVRDKKAECVIAHYWAAQPVKAPAPVDTTADVCLANHAARFRP